MTDILRPVLELFVIIPGILLAYLPVKNYLRQTPLKLTAWLFPLLLGICIFGGAVCCTFHFPTRWILFPLLPVIMLIYHKTLKISVWKSVSIFLAVFAVLHVSIVFPGQSMHLLLLTCILQKMSCGFVSVPEFSITSSACCLFWQLGILPATVFRQ